MLMFLHFFVTFYVKILRENQFFVKDQIGKPKVISKLPFCKTRNDNIPQNDSNYSRHAATVRYFGFWYLDFWQQQLFNKRTPDFRFFWPTVSIWILLLFLSQPTYQQPSCLDYQPFHLSLNCFLTWVLIIFFLLSSKVANRT